MLGLPEGITACLFDLDGVLTQTARVHNAAWAETFDAYLRQRADRTGEAFRPFDPAADYNSYVDGRPRSDGVRTFLASRGIELPEGSPDDPPERETIAGLGNRKNKLLLELLASRGVDVYPDSVRYVRACRSAGLGRAVVSASANAQAVLRAAGLREHFDIVVDGVVARADGLAGKPSPETFLAGAARLGVAPQRAAVFEDAVAGVQAGRAGGFGYVVGVDRASHADELAANGASIVVTNLSELMAEGS